MNTQIISIYLHDDGNEKWSPSVHANINDVESSRIMIFDAKSTRAEALQVAAQWITDNTNNPYSGLIFQ